MTTRLLILRNLFYFRKSHLSTLAGVVLGTAVLTGALLVGDSVRFSLLSLRTQRLGKINYILRTPERVFDASIADGIRSELKLPAAGILMTEGTVLNPDNQRFSARIQVTGVDTSFLKMWDLPPVMPGADEALISRNLAERLGLNPGDEMILKVRKPEEIPANAPFAAESAPLSSLRLRVRSILPDLTGGRFSLKSEQSAPLNVFVPLSTLGIRLKTGSKINTVCIDNKAVSTISQAAVDTIIRKYWSAEDAGFSFRKVHEPDTWEFRSNSIFISPGQYDAFKKVVPVHERCLTYLANALRTREQSTPYSFVTAADSSLLGINPGPGGIIINSWLAEDLALKTGDSLWLSYYRIGPMRTLLTDSAQFIVCKIIGLNDPLSDRSLMPDFPGMTEAGNCRDWETGAPVDLSQIRDKDEKYWQEFRGTPKAFISIDRGKQLWKNDFGNFTALRFQADSLKCLQYRERLLSLMPPSSAGFMLLPVGKAGEAAASPATDFGELFLSLSFFIILSGIMLTVLLYRLHAIKRRQEIALLSALGFGKGLVTRILFLELLLIVLAGSLIGSLAGIAYNKAMILGLNSIWSGAVNASSLQVHVSPGSLQTGCLLGIFISLAALALSLRRELRIHPSTGLRKLAIPVRMKSGNHRRWLILAITFFLLFLLLLAATLSGWVKASTDMMAMISGAILLTAFLALTQAFLVKTPSPATLHIPRLKNLIIRNLRFSRTRNLTAISLLTLGTFSVMITGVHRQNPVMDASNLHSGTGGFLLWMETTRPLTVDLGTVSGRQKAGLEDEPLLRNLKFIQLHRVRGDDASCLNLNHVATPPLAGIESSVFDSLQAFSFATLLPGVPSDHPWKGLEQEEPGGVIPVFADMTVITWGLLMKPGDTLLYPAEDGTILKLRISAGLNNSIFQGNLLIPEQLLKKHFPASSRPDLLLVKGPFEEQDTIAGRLSYLLRDYGISIEKPSERLQSFAQVENTYLYVFMILGGLGILIGVIGLGIILLKSMGERKQEIALYQALGFDNRQISRILSGEYLGLLLAGLCIGLLSAIPATSPVWLHDPGDIPFGLLISFLVLVFLTGYFWIRIPARRMLKMPLLPSLSEEN